MKIEEIKRLLVKFENGKTTPDEEQKLRDYFESNNIPEELNAYADQFQYFREMKQLEPTEDFDPFDKIDFEAQEQTAKPTLARRSLQAAAGFVILVVGFSAGLFIGNDAQLPADERESKYSDEIQKMSNVLLYNPDEQATASERISAVNISAEIPITNDEIANILIHTMNTDDNVNVKLAAAEALFRFRENPRVQSALVNALRTHDNPMMQITLINILVEMKQESAIGEMQQMLAKNDLRPVVKERLQQGIQLLKFQHNNFFNGNS